MILHNDLEEPEMFGHVVSIGGSSILDFELTSVDMDIRMVIFLPLDVGGIAGIPTDISKTFREFQITDDSIDGDTFSGWT